jgi:hypothetical protein
VKRIFPLVLLALALSACTIRVDVGVNVKDDESGTFSAFIGLDQQLQEALAQSGAEDTNIVDQLTSQVPEGFTVEKDSVDGFDGARISTDFSSFADLNNRLQQQADSVGTNLVTDFGLTHEGNEFHFSADLGALDQGFTSALSGAAGGDLPSGVDPSMLSDLFDIRFQLTLPGKITDNNADSIDGNTLTWNLALDDQRSTLMAVSTTAGSSSAIVIGGVAVVAALLLGGGVAMSRRKKKKAAVDAVENAPVDPVS